MIMTPGPGDRLLRFVGDRLRFTIRSTDGRTPEGGWRAFLRTTLGRARQMRRGIIHAHTGQLGLATSPWRDVPMHYAHGQWQVELALTEVGFFKSKPFLVDQRGWQHWPHGPDPGVSVHPDQYRTANTIYCAFARLFGPTREASSTRNDTQERLLSSLEQKGFAVLPPSGKLRDLARQLPHIMETLGCRILHLLPIHPTPTTYARFGRFGSPYAWQNLSAVDPALVEFDRRTTGIDQFRELSYAVHLRGGRVFLDVVINHTGWGSTLQEFHPEWFVRHPDGSFASPGAWGVTWEDLVEMHHGNPALWEYLADVFLEWCRRGVDGFRCDAGYKIPPVAWQYIIARVQDEFPETVFLLEGLGGSWEATETLLTEGGMQWAYSELFQNYTGSTIADYLDYALAQSHRVGLYVHYSETHDNDRLAKKGPAWALLRNQLCALTSVSGGFGFTCGVEWLASEKIHVHQSVGLAWNATPNLVPELARLSQLLCHHPSFFDHATVTRLSEAHALVLAFSRVAAHGQHKLLVLANTDVDNAQPLALPAETYQELGAPRFDLLTEREIPAPRVHDGRVHFQLPAGACLCLGAHAVALEGTGDGYRQERAQSAWALQVLCQHWAPEEIGDAPWSELAGLVRHQPADFLVAVPHLQRPEMQHDLLAALRRTMAAGHYPNVVRWLRADARRVCPVPHQHWVLVEDDAPFRVTLHHASSQTHAWSVPMARGHVACFEPLQRSGDASLQLERYQGDPHPVRGTLRFLGSQPDVSVLDPVPSGEVRRPAPSVRSGLILLTNRRGGMARVLVDIGKVQSKYDALLGANLHPTVPVDRHIFVKRLRLWVNADGFISPLHAENLLWFRTGPPAEWCFVASAGDGRAVEVHLMADMLPDKNTTVLRFSRPAGLPAFGRNLPEACQVSITVRLDILDRNFHAETHFNGGTEHHFTSHTHTLPDRAGFEFKPARDRHLRAVTGAGQFHPEPEWSFGVLHPIEESRGQVDREDAFSPGWFEVPLAKGTDVHLQVTAEPELAPAAELRGFDKLRVATAAQAIARANLSPEDSFGQRLALAIQAFLVRRGDGKTVIAGYPWFLDWGRDSLICARGMLAAGLHEEVRQLLVTFGRFAQEGTLPNSIHGEDASNRDTSDAPLWYGLVAEELAAIEGPEFYQMNVDARPRTLQDVLLDIAEGYRRGTPNGIRLDPHSGLIWSPSHFTWMDTNYPAGTPREGYPIEIQALWVRLCQQLARLDAPSAGEPWGQLAQRALHSLQQAFWLESHGYLADLLIAHAQRPAREATPDTALRSNCLLPISLGLIPGAQARPTVLAARHHLVVPGALRSLAPRPVSPPLAIHAPDGRLLNNPQEPYWGHYQGDEDTRRKPAYHNGTAWTWTFPSFCEALARAWDFNLAALTAARAYLGSMDRLLTEGCLGHLPEIVDGDAPHTQRGCDAQAWGATEALRVWKLLQAEP